MSDRAEAGTGRDPRCARERPAARRLLSQDYVPELVVLVDSAAMGAVFWNAHRAWVEHGDLLAFFDVDLDDRALPGFEELAPGKFFRRF